MSREVTFKISKDGSQVEVDAEGFHGVGCMDFAKKTLDALGVMTEKKEKPEMYATGTAGISVQS